MGGGGIGRVVVALFPDIVCFYASNRSEYVNVTEQRMSAHGHFRMVTFHWRRSGLA